MPRSDRPAPSPGRLPGRPPEDRSPLTGQDALDGMADPDAFRARAGSIERDVAASVDAARDAGRLGLIEAALSSAAIAQGRAVDIAVSRRDPYAISQTTRALLSLLDRLGLAPAAPDPSSSGEADEIGAFLAGLSGPQVCDPSVP